MFDDGPRMEQLDVAFARRYFNALNAYFYPDEHQGPTLPWKVAFVGDQDDQAIILQHMMAGLNAHITFDLGLAVVQIAGNSLDSLENDYNRVNALLCSQIPGILKVVDQLSPDLRWTRWLIPDELGVLERALTKLRSRAWLFAIYMAMHPQNATGRRRCTRRPGRRRWVPGTCNRPRGGHRSQCSFAPSPSMRATTLPATFRRSKESLTSPTS